MLFPYSTDAPIYFRPVGTITVIALNCVMFWLTGMGEVMGNATSDFRWLILEFDRIHPLQWITSAFMHASWMHLVGNMIFLWCFGLIVEGKIGWQKFSALYFGICLADGAIIQIPMYMMFGDSLGGALGASGVIFALMAIAMCWAPENDMNCILGLGYYFRSIDVPVFGFAAFYLILQLFPLAFGGLRMSTPMLHLLGMSVGFPFAFYMLKHNLVDCEGWDIVSRWKRLPRNPLAIVGRMFQSHDKREKATLLATAYGSGSREAGQDALRQILENPSVFNPPAFNAAVVSPPPFSNPAPTAASSEMSTEVRHREPAPKPSAIDLFQNAIENDQLSTASAAYRSIRMGAGTHLIGDEVLSRYVKLLGQHGKHIDSLDPLEVLVSRRSRYCNQACLRTALIQLQCKQDPTAAQAALTQMTQPISPQTIAKQRQIIAACESNTNRTRSKTL
ncbi:Rhomboid family protein [Rubripirellula tenax]|uniref:Rhomboid family protein n=1 Tax=Rubripirellula tenax TaxID=2528015 RepID=A0A5C6F6Y8_9BACT|nr:rhomboid family intramembrane serine protease [Rubripirellula tenax]TWU56722.1 Rhomboid family protein [Rubripirellula tenax]